MIKINRFILYKLEKLSNEEKCAFEKNWINTWKYYVQMPQSEWCCEVESKEQLIEIMIENIFISMIIIVFLETS